MSIFEFDELSIYRGRDVQITNKITIIQPTISQIEEFGEKNYFNAVHTLTSVGADLKWQLWDFYQIDYTKISDYDLFVKFTYQLISSKKRLYNELLKYPEKYENELSSLSKNDIDKMLINPLELILKNIDLADFTPMKLKNNTDSEEIILYDIENDITIDRFVYMQIVDAVRNIHGLKRNNQIPANERTKRDLIDDARDEAILSAKTPYKSILKPLVSTLSVYCGQCGDEKIWNMPISMFLDSIKRINKIQDSNALLQGAYSGFSNLKGIDKSRLDMFNDI